MTALPGRGGVTPRPAAPLPRDEADDLTAAVDAAQLACHNVERAMKASIAAHGVTATAQRLGISRATAQRIKGGHWHTATALTKLRDQLRV